MNLKDRKKLIESLKIPNNAPSRARDLMIGSRNSNLSGDKQGAYKTFDRTNPEHPDYINPRDIPGEIKEVQPLIPGLEDFLVHHKNPNAGEGAGLDGFKEPPSINDILESIILNETLSDEEKARTIKRIIPDQDPQEIINKFKRQLEQRQKDSLKIGVA